MKRVGMSLLALGGLGISCVGMAQTPRPPLPIEVFAELPTVTDPKLSPDGTRYVARVALNGQQFLAAVSVSGKDKPVLLGDNGSDINWWKWVNDEWLVLGIGDAMPIQGQTWYVSRAVAYNVVTKKMIALLRDEAAQNGDDVIWTARDGSARLLIAYQSSIYSDSPGFWPKVEEFDLATGKHRTVQDGRAGVMNWYADAQGVVRMGIGRSDSGRESRLLYRSKAQELLKVVDRARGPNDSLSVPVLFSRDGAAMVIKDDAQGFSSLYAFNLATMTPGAQIFASKGYDIGGIVADRDGTGLWGVEVTENASVTRWLDPAMVAMHDKIAALVKGARIEIVSVSKDGGRAMVQVGGADAPGGWYVYDAAENVMIQVAVNNRAIGMKRMHTVKTIRYKARDGVEIAAVLTTPAGRTGKLPLIVMPHGGPFARDSEEWDWWAQFLADRGYLVVQPNYRGSSGFGTTFARLGEGQWGLAMQDDLNDAVKTLADQGIADPARVCMVGGSYGGYAAMRAAQRDGKSYRCAVSYAGVSDLNRMQHYSSRFLFGAARIDWLRDQAPDLKTVSPVNYPEAFSIPVLLMHGEKDLTVPPVHSRIMAERLKAAKRDVTYIIQPQADHHFRRQADRLEFLKALEAFLAKHNPA